MIVGIPKEVKDNEYRVAATPEGVRELVACGTSRRGPGRSGRRLRDRRRRLRRRRRRRSLPDADAVFAAADMIAQGEGAAAAGVRAVPRGPGPVHLPPPGRRRGADAVPRRAQGRERSPTRPCRRSDGRLPLLAPMSEIAGRMAPHVRRRRPGAAARRPRRADGRRVGRGAGEGGGPGRGDGGIERGLDRRRDGGGGH